jgi:protein MpaA
MSNSPDASEFQHLQNVYRDTCDAFERGELTSPQARELIVGLRHLDRFGVEWKVDITRSGKKARFIRVGSESSGGDPRRDVAPDGLANLNRQYQDICAAFDRGELSSESARDQVLALRYTDSRGRTWMIDSKRSGRNAAFVEDPEAMPRPTPRPPAPTRETAQYVTESRHRTSTIEREATSYRDAFDDDDNGYAERRPPLVRSREIAFVATVLVGGLALIMRPTAEPSQTDTTDPAVSTSFAPIPTVNENPNQTFPLITSFTDRASIPFDTEIEFGRSVQNRPLTFIRRGNPNGVRVVVVGVIHGDETAGLAVIDLLKKASLPSNIDMWILPMLNPDGYLLKTRQNANKVDLNRNFPVNWKPIGEKGFWQWSGLAAATEPETAAMLRFGNIVQPEFSVWYHQDYFRISPASGREGQVRKRYAELVDLPLLKITGGSYSGTAAMWSETLNKGNTMSLTVEFGKGLRDGEAEANASAVVKVVDEFFAD